MRTIRVVGVPFALGGSKAGPAKGPGALVDHGLFSSLDFLRRTYSYVDVREACGAPEVFTSPPVLSGRVCSETAVREVTKLAGAYVFAAHRLGQIPLVLGGDHSISMGTLPQYLDPTLSRGRSVGLLWLDAHYDAHTPKTSHSHYANGLPLASVLGRGERSFGVYRMRSSGTMKRLHFHPKSVLHIGAGKSDCEPEETALLAKLGVETITMSDIHEGDGPGTFLFPLRAFLARVDDVIFTFDLDAMRKDYVPGVSFQSWNGLFPWHAFAIADAVRESGKLRQIEIVEYNPDFEEFTPAGRPKTADFVAEFLERLFEKKGA